jgi:hypothetical protein
LRIEIRRAYSTPGQMQGDLVYLWTFTLQHCDTVKRHVTVCVGYHCEQSTNIMECKLSADDSLIALSFPHTTQGEDFYSFQFRLINNIVHTQSALVVYSLKGNQIQLFVIINGQTKEIQNPTFQAGVPMHGHGPD